MRDIAVCTCRLLITGASMSFGGLAWGTLSYVGGLYGPGLIPYGYTQTSGELSHEVKYAIDHRARAFAKLKQASLGDPSDHGS